jgi:four helix bundle protein
MRGDNIATRLRRFAVDVIKLVRAFPGDPASRHIVRQLARAATAGGANYEEARGAESRSDFAHKLSIANKEVRESMYWLLLAGEAELVASAAVAPLTGEANELISILTASIRTARAGAGGTARAGTGASE